MPHEIGRLKTFIAEAGEDDLRRRLSELKEDYFNLRIRQATSALDNPKAIWLVRKQIARVRTALRQRELEAEAQAQAQIGGGE